MSKVIEPCSKCELPIDPEMKNAALHDQFCIGQTPYVLHNRKAGMVVYLSEAEWEALHDPLFPREGSEFDTQVTANVAGRAVFGIDDSTEALPAEG